MDKFLLQKRKKHKTLLIFAFGTNNYVDIFNMLITNKKN